MSKKPNGKESTTLRQKLLASYDFSDDPAALTLLDELVLTHSQLRTVQATIARDGLVVQGTTGPRSHPLLAEQDRLRRTLLSITRSLRLTLPEEI